MIEDKAQISNRIDGIFSGMWTRTYTLSSWARYPHYSRKRVLLSALDRHSVVQNPGLSVLDYGFGLGHGLFAFGTSCRLHGVDLSADAIESATKRAKRRGYVHFDFKKPPADDVLRIEYPSDSFDVVICAEVAQHVYDDVRLLSELLRVLKPGGKCFLVTASDLDHHKVIADPKERLNPNFPERSLNVRLYNEETFLWVVREVGFKDIEGLTQDSLFELRLRQSRPVQIAMSLALAATPYSAWRWLDLQMQRRGHNPARIVVVATKGVKSQRGSLVQ